MHVLTKIPAPPSSYFTLGPFMIHYYAIIILTAAAVAVWLTSRRLTRRGGPPGAVLDITIWAAAFGIVGGRFYHVVTHPGDYFYPGADLVKVFAVWEGGLAIFGAVIFGGLGAYIGCRRAGIRFLSFADALAPALLIAQGIGRLGCYFAQELYGAPTTLPWGLEVSPSNPAFPAGLPAGTLFHPLFLYEMLWNFLGAGLILLAERKFSLRWGRTIALYLIWYGVGRTWLEALRLDPTEFLLFGVKINMVTAMAAAVLGLVLLVVQTRRHASPEISVFRPRQDRTQPNASGAEPQGIPASADATGSGPVVGDRGVPSKV